MIADALKWIKRLWARSPEPSKGGAIYTPTPPGECQERPPKPSRPRRQKLANLLSNAIEDMDRAERDRHTWTGFGVKRSWIDVDLSAFSGAHLMNPDVPEIFPSEGDSDASIPVDLRPIDIWPVHQNHIVRARDDDTEWAEIGGAKWYLHGMDTITARDVRGKVSAVSPYMAIARMGVVSHTGQFSAIRQIVAWIGNAWTVVGPQWSSNFPEGPPENRNRPEYDYRTEESIQICLGLAFWRQFVWSVTLRNRDFGISVSADPVGIQAMFRNREKPLDGGRRKALRHWVSEHDRIYRRDPVVETWVRQHMRGATSFDWYGFNVQIGVCPYDDALAESLRQERLEGFRRDTVGRRWVPYVDFARLGGDRGNVDAEVL